MRLLVVLGLLLPLMSAVVPASAIISTPISIDGDLSDWAGVRADPQNAVHDTQISDPDPDYPGQPDRDVYLVNATWDSQFLYLAYRRTSGGTKAIVFGAYIDLNGDGLLQNSDVVCSWQVNQSGAGRFADAHASSPTAHILRYNQAITGKDGPILHPGGDPMGYDGETPDGWADIQSGQIVPAAPMDGWMATNGIDFEGRVAWTDLGVPAGSPIAIHFVNANGESFCVKWVPSNTRKWTGNPPQYLEESRGQVEDNVDGIWWLRLKGVDVSPDNTGGGEAGETIVYNHTIKNTGNASDTFDLSALSSHGWPFAITNTGGAPLSSVTLAPGASQTVQVRVTIPVGTVDGTRDTTTLTAVSHTDATIVDTATDTTAAGRITITPDRSASMAPGQIAAYTFTVTNNLATAGVFDLSTASSLSFPGRITNVGGADITSVSLAAGASTQVVVHVSVPSTATIGSQDITRLTAVQQGAPTVRATASATTRVEAGLTITPNRALYAGANSLVDYRHTITNSWPTTRTITLSATSSRGWTVRFYAADGVTPITTVTLGPNGAATDVIARVTVPAGTGSGVVDTTTVHATTGSTTAAVTDTTTVRQLAIFDSSGYTNQASAYSLTDTVYGRGAGLPPGSSVYFVWRSPSGAIMRTSPMRTVDTDGQAYDAYPSTATDLTGGWTLELHSSGGALLETTPFTMKWKAAITALSATDAPRVGDRVDVTSSVQNRIGRAITNSTMTYVMWWDENGDGLFGAGDTWIDGAGAPRTWDGVSAVSSHTTTGINVASNGTWTESAPWNVVNSKFPHQGTYNVTATWRESGGALIDAKTSQFFSIPAMGWPLAGIAAIAGGWWLWRRRDSFAPAGRVVRP